MTHTKHAWRLLDKLICRKPETTVWPSAGLSMPQTGSPSISFHHLSTLNPDNLKQASGHSPGSHAQSSAHQFNWDIQCSIRAREDNGRLQYRREGGAQASGLYACAQDRTRRRHTGLHTAASSAALSRHIAISSTGSTQWANCAKAHSPFSAPARGLSTSRASPEQAASSSPGSSKDGPAADLKTALRRLYKRVHPDMCGDDLDARAENERSFKLLQEYLGKARSTSGDARDSMFPQLIRAYRFVFHLCDQPASSGDADGNEKASQDVKDAPNSTHSAAASIQGGAKFRRVEVSLKPPPPAPPSPPKDGAETPETDLRLHPEARSGLVRLMQACGIEVAFSSKWLEEEEASMAHQRLSTFLPDAAEALRRAESGSVTDGVRAATMRGAMRLQRKVLVSFKQGSQVAPRTQVTALQTLAQVLDSAPVRMLDLSGCNIIMGSGPGIDRLGNLLLDLGPAGVVTQGQPELSASHFSALALEWRDLLLGVDLDFVKSRKAYVQAVRELEGSVAASLGVAAIFGTNPQHLIAEPSYRELLERLAAAAAERGPMRKPSGHDQTSNPTSPSQSDTAQQHGQPQQQQQQQQGGQQQEEQQQQQQRQEQQRKALPFQDVAISVWSEYAFAMSHQQQQQQQQGQQQGQQGLPICMVDEDLGALRVHDGLSAEQVYAAVIKHGERARVAMARNRHRDAELGRLVERVRRTLRLRRLLRDERVAIHHFQSACRELLEQKDALAHVLEGSSVRISFMNRVAPDSSFIDIAYNFRL